MTTSPACRRSLARMDSRLPVRIRMIDDADAAAIAERLSVEPSSSERVAADPATRHARAGSWDEAALSSILAQLDRLERAVARIADAMRVDLTDAGAWVEGETVNLSGAGLGVHVPQRIEQGSLLELEMTLLGDPTIVLRAVGRVVSLLHPDGNTLPVGRYHLGIAFDVIHEEDRQALVQYTFRLQREQLRRRKSESDTRNVTSTS